MMCMVVEMDIKKVREAFEKLPEIRDSLSEHIVFIGNKYTTPNTDFYDLVNWLNGAWYAWQAKAQAVLEGFGDIQSWIAVNSFSALDAIHENVPIIDANELAKYIDSLIEAQEQSHD